MSDMTKKYVRCNYDGAAHYGILEGEAGKEEVFFLDRSFLEEGAERTGAHAPLSEVRLLAPLDPVNIICVGLNYKSHAEESEMELPEIPLLFMKTTNALCGPEDPILLPKIAPDNVDYEGELVIVIGKTAKHVAKEAVGDYVFGYTIANDVSARDCQLHIDTQWVRGKSMDTFCPLGPVVVSGLDTSALDIETRVNGAVMQSSNTERMIFDVPTLVSFISENMTLKPGTVILSGTPEGVGFSRIPPVWLREGDTVEITVEGIGTLKNTVKKEI